jgi:hypothetical protein
MRPDVIEVDHWSDIAHKWEWMDVEKCDAGSMNQMMKGMAAFVEKQPQIGHRE